jgi:hypothetical protein
VAIEESQRLVYASASDHGHLAWATSRASDNVLALYAHDGRRLRMLDVPPGSLAQPTISPDGNRLLFIRVERGGADVVLHNLTTNATDRVTTSPDYEEFPIWVPDGSGFVFVGRAAGGWALFRQTIGGGDPEEFYKDNSPAVGFEAPGRRYVLVNVSNDASGEDVVARMADGSIVPLLMGPANEGILALSNDGRTVILRQQSGSRSAVLAARVTLEGATVTLGPLQTVTEGSAIASLRSDGREALALMPDGTVKSALLASSDATLSVGAVTTLFQAPKTATELSISPSGQQIVIVESPFAQGQTIRLLTHWETRLK